MGLRRVWPIRRSNTGEAAGDSYTSIEGLIGTSGSDTLIGDGGDNFLRGGPGGDSLQGGGGSDTADYSQFFAIPSGVGVTADLSNPANNTGDAAGDTYTSIENLSGSNFADTLKGDANANVLTGGFGGDTFVYVTGGGADTISDFNHGEADKIDLTGVTGVHTLAEVQSHATQNGANTVIDFGSGDTLTLQNVTLGNLTASDFQFGSSTAVTLNVATASGIDLSFATLYDEMANSPIGAGGSSTQFTNVDTGAFNGHTANGIQFVVSGVGFTYSGSFPNIQLTGGTINSVVEKDASNITLATFSGFHIDAVAFNSAMGSYVTGHQPVANGGDNTPDASALNAIFNAYQYNATGGSGNDIFQGGNLADTVSGGAGNDTFIGGPGADSADGGAGNDTASYQTATAGLTVDLLTPANNTGDAAGDSYVSIEGLRGSAFNDVLSGDNNNNMIEGGAGADTLDGRGGNDYASYAHATAGLIVEPGQSGQQHRGRCG